MVFLPSRAVQAARPLGPLPWGRASRTVRTFMRTFVPAAGRRVPVAAAPTLPGAIGRPGLVLVARGAVDRDAGNAVWSEHLPADS